MLKTNQEYEFLARQYAEKFGIVTYKVKGNLLIYNQNYSNVEFIGGRYVSNPCTYQRTINLDTNEVSSVRLQRLNKNGWDNV